MSKNAKPSSRVNKKKRWFTVRVLFRATGKGQPKLKRLYEDRLILVRAASHAEAKRRAWGLAQATEVPYRNMCGNLVVWKVFDVVDSVDLFEDEDWDGKQLYWRYFNSAEPLKSIDKSLMNGLV